MSDNNARFSVPAPPGFARALEQLRTTAGRLPAAIDQAFPPGEDTYVGPTPGCPFEPPLNGVSAAIDDMLAAYDILQKTMGWSRETRHERFLTGRDLEDTTYRPEPYEDPT